MHTAFKEWAIIVDALGRGEQIVILRKGGISEGRGGFQASQPEFLLFPTQFHQQRESVLPEIQARYEPLAAQFPPAGILRLEYFARVAEARKLDSLAAVESLRGQHVWRDEVIAERFDWGKEQAIFALAIRVYRLPQAVDMAMMPAYGGCKSWIELEPDVTVDGGVPVLSEVDFTAKLECFRNALGARGMVTA